MAILAVRAKSNIQWTQITVKSYSVSRSGNTVNVDVAWERFYDGNSFKRRWYHLSYSSTSYSVGDDASTGTQRISFTDSTVASHTKTLGADTGFTEGSKNYSESDTFTVTIPAKEFTLTFNANGGTASESSRSVKYNTAYGTLPTATRTGYTFNGWYTAASGGSAVSSSTKMGSSDTTIYAQWTANTYALKFRDDDGTTSLASDKTVTYNAAYGTLPTPTKTGHNFDGWYTATSGGSQVTSSSVHTTAGNRTIYAHWSSGQYTVTFKPNGGTTDVTSKKVTYNSTYGELPTPTRAGYKFLGWYDAQEGGNKKTASSTVTTGANHNLWAHWEVSAILHLVVGGSVKTVTSIWVVVNNVPKQVVGVYVSINGTVKQAI